MRQYYEIRRAKTIAEISARHGEAAAQRGLSIAGATATDGHRSKVHPADKYIGVSAAPFVDANRAPSAMGPEPNGAAEEELAC